MIRVLIVDDSMTVRQALAHILSNDRGIDVIGFANDGLEAVRMAEVHKPDVITMDVLMPGMDGIEATRAIMERTPTPIVIVSSCYNSEEMELSYRAIEAGAVAILPKPLLTSCGHGNDELEFVRTIKIMSEVKVVKRTALRKPRSIKQDNLKPHVMKHELSIIGIGASTGGPPVLKTILSALPEDFPLPILIVQHISHGFLEGMIRWIQPSCKLQINIASGAEIVKGGSVYFAPDDRHMGVDSSGCIFLSDAPTEHGVRPSVSFMFRSLLNSYGENAMGILLTGMGKDGSLELSQMHLNKSLTIVQDEDTSVVFGMPGEAVKLGGASYILPPHKIVSRLLMISKRQ